MTSEPTHQAATPEPARTGTEDHPEAPAGAPYEPPRLVVHDADEFIRGLGPAVLTRRRI